VTDAERGPTGFETAAIHAGQPADPSTGAVVTPISLATTFAQDAVGKHAGFEYGRTGNPTRAALEECLAVLEGATRGLAFASGMAAEDAVLRALLRPDDHVVLPHDAYGGTFRLVARVYSAAGVEWSAVDLADLDALEDAIHPETRVVWVETPTNPALGVVDIEAVARVAHAHDVRVVVDNTFATPLGQNPLALGADVVLHSATKLIGGHSDLLMGAAVTADASLDERLRRRRQSNGATPGVLEAFLALRGLRTLPARLGRAQDSARELVRRLSDHAGVARVRYPGSGTMVSFETAGTAADAEAVCEACRLIVHATSLGGVETSLERRARYASEREVDTPPTLIRLSVGLEHVDDLWRDLERALG
jgi:cystathionine gamma-synthase